MPKGSTAYGVKKAAALVNRAAGTRTPSGPRRSSRPRTRIAGKLDSEFPLYDKASAIAHKADDDGKSLRDAALTLGVSAADLCPTSRHGPDRKA